MTFFVGADPRQDPGKTLGEHSVTRRIDRSHICITLHLSGDFDSDCALVWIARGIEHFVQESGQRSEAITLLQGCHPLFVPMQAILDNGDDNCPFIGKIVEKLARSGSTAAQMASALIF